MRLPKQTNLYNIPERIAYAGVNPEMGFKEERNIVENNNKAFTKALYEKLNFSFKETGDPLFYEGKLPEGWSAEQSGMYWQHLKDINNVIRAKVFSKTTAWDETAFIVFTDNAG